ncbi:MAG: crotonase/enoyl-CoA hydratase family protein [Janthinobacterium lividum]
MTHSSNVNIIAEHNEQQSRRQQQPWRAENLTRPGAFGAVEFEFDESIGTLWCYMSPTGDPHVSPALLADLGKAQAAIRAGVLPEQSGPHPLIRTMVLASRMPGVYSLGGDLRMFADCIQQQNRTLLRDYAHRCVDIVFNHSEGYGQGLTTFSLVQGQALGGGFEAALSAHVIVAERSARLGLPEVLFNLFPGMGAYSFLSRRMAPAAAERMILSGKVHTAEELYELGLVDVLAEDGEGVATVRQHIRELDRRQVSRRAMRHVCNAVNPITRDELIRVTDIWVEAALRLTEDDLRRMRRLAAAQNRLRPNRAVQAAE